MIIAKGSKPDILLKLFSGEAHGTYFSPRKKKLNSRKCWIAYTLMPKGSLILDSGAAQALLHRGKSLLPSGILDVEGEFSPGAPVAIRNQAYEEIGIGLVNYSAAEIRIIKGLHTDEIVEHLGGKLYDVVIHRDNMVIAERV